MKDKVKKFLSSCEGPYFIVGLLDDLVYRIQKSQRSKVKVVHHDKLKPYYSRTALDNSWVFQSADAWSPVEAPPPALDEGSADPDIGPLNLWDTPSETQDAAVGASQGPCSPSQASPNSSQHPIPSCHSWLRLATRAIHHLLHRCGDPRESAEHQIGLVTGSFLRTDKCSLSSKGKKREFYSYVFLLKLH